MHFFQEAQGQIDQVEVVGLLQVVQRMEGVVVEEQVGLVHDWV